HDEGRRHVEGVEHEEAGDLPHADLEREVAVPHGSRRVALDAKGEGEGDAAAAPGAEVLDHEQGGAPLAPQGVRVPPDPDGVDEVDLVSGRHPPGAYTRDPRSRNGGNAPAG